MPRPDYTVPTFTDVPPAQWGSPPAGAVALDAAHLNAMANAIGKSAVVPVPASDRHVFVSQNGSDSNDGGSWGSAKLTIAAAISALGTQPGTVEIGAGNFAWGSAAPSYGQVLRGRSRYATVIQATTSGTLVNLTNQSYLRFEHLGFAFASSSVVGTLVLMSNAFTCDFEDVRFSGQKAATQVGVKLSNNAGDSQFVSCYWESLDVGIQNDTTVNHVIGCVFTDHLTAALQGGDPTGVNFASGITCSDCTFRGTGTYYINVAGSAQAWHIKGCWFDSTATTAVSVGTGTFGPWLFSMIDVPYLAGATNSLVLNASQNTELHGVIFGDGGSHPTDLTVNAANCPKGTLGSYKSLAGRAIDTIVPPTWRGASVDATFTDVSQGGGSGSTVGQSIADAFTTIQMATVNSDTGARYNTTTYLYTVPATGLYLCSAKLRLTDGAGTATANIGLGIGTATADGPHFQWQPVGSVTSGRRTFAYQRLAKFNAGDQLRLYTYYDNGGVAVTLAAAQMSIVKVG